MPIFRGRVSRRFPRAARGNRVYNRYFTSDERPAKVKPMVWEAAWVFAAARAFAEDSPLHKATTGTHSCYLVLGGTVVICREDLGRHNAFDKVVGAALRGGHRFAGRADLLERSSPVDMVMKAIHAGVPILATKAVPTDETHSPRPRI